MLTKKEFKEIRAELLLLDVTQQQIAKKFYISKQLVGQYLRGMHDSDQGNKVREHVTGILNRNPWEGGVSKNKNE